MALKIGDNFSYQGKKPNFDRDTFDTLASMKSYPETSIDDGHISYCKETFQHYVYNSSNTSDATTGKWRVLVDDISYFLPGIIKSTDNYADESAITPIYGTYADFEENIITKNKLVIAKVNYNDKTCYTALTVAHDAVNFIIRLIGKIDDTIDIYIRLNYNEGTWITGNSNVRTILHRGNIVDNLTTASATSILSANQGKILQDTKLNKTDVVNNLTTTVATKALSAAQGKILNDKITALGNVYRVRGTKATIAEVLALTDAKVGDVWNVTNAFTLNNLKYSANTNVVCITATSSSDHNDDNWDALGGIIATDFNYYKIKDVTNLTDLESEDIDTFEEYFGTCESLIAACQTAGTLFYIERNTSVSNNHFLSSCIVADVTMEDDGSNVTIYYADWRNAQYIEISLDTTNGTYNVQNSNYKKLSLKMTVQ